MRCDKCGGVVSGSWGNGDVCQCVRVTDPELGISMRLIQKYDPNTDAPRWIADPFPFPFRELFGPAPSEPTVPWQLTDEDKYFLRTRRIGVD